MNRNKKCSNFLCFANCKCVKMEPYCLNSKIKNINILDLPSNIFTSNLWVFFLSTYLIKKSRYNFYFSVIFINKPRSEQLKTMNSKRDHVIKLNR